MTRTMPTVQNDVREHLTTILPGEPDMSRKTYRLLTSGDDSAKLVKGETSIYSMSMPQHKLWINRDTGKCVRELPTGSLADWLYVGNVCPFADGCVETCIANTGRLGMGQTIKRAWVRVLWSTNKALFLELLALELSKLDGKARKVDGDIAVRLNLSSDVKWERYVDMSKYGAIRFYDYTKARTRSDVASNYDITFSVTRRQSVADMTAAVAVGRRLAVVVPTKADAAATTFAGLPAVSGDVSDERFKDPAGVVVLLYVKRPTNGADVADIYRGGMVRNNDGSIADVPVKVGRRLVTV